VRCGFTPHDLQAGAPVYMLGFTPCALQAGAPA